MAVRRRRTVESDFRCDGPLSGRDDLRRDVNNLHTERPLYPVALDSKSR